MLNSSPNSPDGDSGRPAKRRRVKTTRYDAEFLDNEEHLMLQQVLVPRQRMT